MSENAPNETPAAAPTFAPIDLVALAETAGRHGMSLELTSPALTFRAWRARAAAAPAPMTLETTISEPASAVKSPIAGVGYIRPEPGAKPFVEIGSVVRQGDLIALVATAGPGDRVMFHEIVAPHAGTVSRILVTDEAEVTIGQVLMMIDAAAPALSIKSGASMG